MTVRKEAIPFESEKSTAISGQTNRRFLCVNELSETVCLLSREGASEFCIESLVIEWSLDLSVPSISLSLSLSPPKNQQRGSTMCSAHE